MINKQTSFKEKTSFGAASLTRALNGISFPITKRNVIEKFGNKEITYSKSNTKKIEQLMEKCSQQEFRTMSELVEACSKRGY